MGLVSLCKLHIYIHTAQTLAPISYFPKVGNSDLEQEEQLLKISLRPTYAPSLASKLESDELTLLKFRVGLTEKELERCKLETHL